MKILKNDVTAILDEKVKSKSARNRQSSIFPPGPDKRISLCRRIRYNNIFSLSVCLCQGTLTKHQDWIKFVNPKIRSHSSKNIWKEASG